MSDQARVPLYLYHGPELAAYGFGHGHPFGPDRHDVFIAEAERRGLLADAGLRAMAAVKCDEDDLRLFHHSEYIQQVQRQSLSGQGFLDCGDTPAFKGVYDIASYVVGSTLDAAQQIMQGNAARAFIPIAGLHHAARNSAAGFCVFNDIGVAAEALKQRFGLTRIAYIDIDAHHGDGVFYGFENDPSVIIVDAHEDGRYLYPGTGGEAESGIGAGQGLKLNIPLAPNCDDHGFSDRWQAALSFLQRHPAQFYILQCGADSIAGDPITHLRLSPETHAMVTRQLLQLAHEHANGRLLALGGGGYNRANIAATWCRVLEQMLHRE